MDAVEELLRKGNAVLIKGRLVTREYRDREGVDRRIAEIVVAGPQGLVNVRSGRRDTNEGGTAAPEVSRA